MSWLYVPAGIMVILAICFGIHSLIGLSTVSFPASVACMILLFFFLIGCELVLGDRKTKAIVRVIDVPVSGTVIFIAHHILTARPKAGFTLRYINIFFCPSFILLPLSPAVSGVNVAKIIAVFSMYHAREETKNAHVNPTPVYLLHPQSSASPSCSPSQPT